MTPGFSNEPRHDSYDVVIVGGAIMGASTAWFLADNPDFDGRVLVIERDSSYRDTSTMTTTSCMRQQFSTELNVKIAQFAADFVKNLPRHLQGIPDVPQLSIRSFGYMYLAATEGFAERLRTDCLMQRAAGADTCLMTPDQIAQKYPFYALDDIILGSINTRDEGYFDATAVFDAVRRASRLRGVEYVEDEVIDMGLNAAGSRVEAVTLKSGRRIGCGQIVNASGPRADRTARMAGIDLAVEPRKRYSWIFKAERPLDQDLPLTIDPSGLHVRENGGGTYQVGAHFGPDPAVDYDDFTVDHSLWESEAWPIVATRIPRFEAVKLQSTWVGHYAMNTFDHNAIMGPHDRVENFIFLNGFSGHGLQQAPAMGRGTAEWLTYGSYRTMDLTPFNYARFVTNTPIVEHAVI